MPKDQLNEQTRNKCLDIMRSHYSRHWADNTKPYPGIPELLYDLQKRKLPKAILSNKPDNFTQIMTAKLLANWDFEIVEGAKPSVPKKPDPETALKIAKKLAIHPEDILYLGDTNTDMQTARAAGMYAVGVLWGFRDAKELLTNGAKALVEKPSDVLSILNGKTERSI